EEAFLLSKVLSLASSSLAPRSQETLGGSTSDFLPESLLTPPLFAPSWICCPDLNTNPPSPSNNQLLPLQFLLEQREIKHHQKPLHTHSTCQHQLLCIYPSSPPGSSPTLST
ncbi:hypothetical protein ATANTOWER_010734, partial [Ataeniobius toweri]|nr:hypothetical protein [Ataeniobius toweri]